MVSVIGFLLVVVIGYFLLNLLASDLAFEEKLSLSYGMGIGFTSLLVFLMLCFNFFNSKIHLIILMLLVAIALFAVRGVIGKLGTARLNDLSKRTIFSRSGWFSQLNYKLYLTVLPLFVVSLIFSYYYPIMIADGIGYEVTGKLMAVNRAIEPENYFIPYPPLIPGAYSFIYLFGGSHLKIIFPLFYLSLVLCFYFRLIALGVNKKSSLMFTLVLATTPYIWWHSFLGILNLTAAYYFSIATLFWFSHLSDISESGDEAGINYSHPLLAGVFYSLSIFTRFEMLVYFLIPLIFTAFYSLRYRLPKSLLYLAFPPLFISSLWSFFSHYTLSSSEDFQSFPIAVIILIVAVVLSYFVVIKKGDSTLIDFINKYERQIFQPLKVLGLSFIFLLIMYVFIPKNVQNNIGFISQFLFFVKTLVMRSIIFIFGNVFFFSTSVLIVLLPIKKYESFRREDIYLISFILSFLLINIMMFSWFYFSLYPRGYSMLNWSYDLVEFFRTIVLHPGSVINSAQIRGLLPIYPVIIFFFAISRRIQKAFEV